ncbi:MFS transporter [Saccharopolyspora sp. ASAGF58]|uniref:MFS transporter n=1 Tax=Saccharopolyspora sp. ASAGF58 TaxID=2719023 RepID=UPI00143FBA04|nr:MFS transporter [Saccharopolyspora sp. ASAGF58]QIZ38188.1 MFS transporter [Saccharopolyspora sp. ASAGF58]
MSAIDADSATGAGLLSRRYRSLTVGALILISSVAFEYVAVATAMPTVVRALDGLTLYAVAFGGTMAAGVVSMVVSGGWSDVRGPAVPLRVGVAVFAAGLLLAGVAPVMWVLVVGRIVQGLGGGLSSVALYVVVGHTLPEELRARFFGLLAGAWLLPSIAGPLVAGLLVEQLSWRWVFLTTAVLAVPSLVLVNPSLRGLSWPVAPQRPRSRRPLWAVGAAAGALLLHYGGQQTGWVPLVLVVAGLGALPVVPLVLCIAGLTVLSLGMGLMYPVLSALTLRWSAPQEQGVNSSALQLSESLFTTTVLAVTGALFAAWLVWSPVTAYFAGFGVASVLTLLAVAVAVRVR